MGDTVTVLLSEKSCDTAGREGAPRGAILGPLLFSPTELDVCGVHLSSSSWSKDNF